MIILKLFITFFKIGLFTFGGGYAMIPLIEENVLSNGWMSIEELINFIAISESTPGPFAVNISTCVGTMLAGFPGAAAATLGVALPSFIIILIVAKFFISFCDNKYVVGCMSGLRPSVTGLIATAVVSVGSSVFFPDGFSINIITSYTFAVSAFIFIVSLILSKKLHPISIIMLSAALGIIFGYIGNI